MEIFINIFLKIREIESHSPKVELFWIEHYIASLPTKRTISISLDVSE